MSRRTQQTQVVSAPRVVVPPTAEELLAELVYDIDCDIKHGKEACDSFALKFASDPGHALEWSSSTFADAARFELATILKKYIDHGRTVVDEYGPISAAKILKEVRDYLFLETMRKAKYPEHSTSVPSNEMSLNRMAKFADYLEKVDRLIKRLPN